MSENPDITYAPGSDHSKKAIASHIVGGQEFPKIIVSGGDSANSLNIDGAGDEITSFHRNINVFFGDAGDRNIEIQTVRISDSRNAQDVVTGASTDIVLEGGISPSHMVVSYESGYPASRSFTLRLSNSLAQNPTLSISTMLVSSIDSASGLDAEYGELGESEAVAEGASSFIIQYSPPAEKPEKSKILFRVTVSADVETADGAVAVSKTFHAIIKFVLYIDTTPFTFTSDTSKTDVINGDYYVGSVNRGLAIFDASLKTADTIDRNDGLFLSELDVRCALRLATGMDQDTAGILLATAGGLVYFESDPFSQPISLGARVKISDIPMKDMVMSGNHLFMLGSSGVIYRIHHKKILYRISQGQAIDDLLELTEHQPLSFNGEASQPYNPVSLPERIMYAEYSTWLNDGAGPVEDIIANQYFDQVEPSKGISVIYQEQTTNKKAMMTVVYAPAYNKEIVSGQDFDDGDSTWTKFYTFSYLDADGSNGPYQYYDSTINDQPKVKLFRDNQIPEFTQYCTPFLTMKPMERAETRIVVMGVDSPVAPAQSFNYLCPRNVDILAVLPYGDNSDVEEPTEEVDTSYIMLYDKEFYNTGDALKLGTYADFTSHGDYMDSLDEKLLAIKKELYPTLPDDVLVDIWQGQVTIGYYADAAGTTAISGAPGPFVIFNNTVSWIHSTEPGTLLTSLPELPGYENFYIITTVVISHSYYRVVNGVFEYYAFADDPDKIGDGKDASYTFRILTPTTRLDNVQVQGEPIVAPSTSLLSFYNSSEGSNTSYSHGSALRSEVLGDGTWTDFISIMIGRIETHLASPGLINDILEVALTVYYYDLDYTTLLYSDNIVPYTEGVVSDGSQANPLMESFPDANGGLDFFVKVKVDILYIETSTANTDTISFFMEDGFDDYVYITK